MRIEDFDYALPPDAIAQEPLSERDASRLLVLRRDPPDLEHRRFRDLPDLLDPGDVLVVNRSRVFPARLLGQRRGGGRAEILLVRPREGGEWDALVRPGRRLRPGDAVEVAEGVRVVIVGASHPGAAERVVRVETADGDVPAALERWGHVPLPPYVHRPDTPADRERYQTVYARERGSVAAPTAGLHFTPDLLDRLEARGIRRAEVVLHVGPGTFRPVTVADVRQHRVEPEAWELPEETAAAVAEARARGGRVVAVGTTSVRVLETAAAQDGTVRSGSGQTDLVVLPGHRFRAVDALVTNFHLPRSSLLLLVSAFAGRERVLAAYARAVAAGYRFYSYGDAMLVV